jgi:hypothetical protein
MLETLKSLLVTKIVFTSVISVRRLSCCVNTAVRLTDKGGVRLLRSFLPRFGPQGTRGLPLFFNSWIAFTSRYLGHFLSVAGCVPLQLTHRVGF